MFQDVALILLAYLVGTIPMAYIVGKVVKGIDLREYGSGNLGGANVWEHVGKAWVIPTGGFDFLVKGMAVVAVGNYLFHEGPVVQGLMGLGAVAGHNWCPYLRWTGGRGVAVGLGALALLSWQQLALLASFGLAGKVLFRHMGLAVFLGVTLVPVTSTLMYVLVDDLPGVLHTESLGVVVFAWGLALLTLAKRALSNDTSLPRGPDRWRVLQYRILYDRDVPAREEWVNRRPTSRHQG